MILSKLYDGAVRFAFSLSDDELRLFGLYMEEIVKWNEKVNLTAITEPDEIIVKHFLDSLALLRILPDMGQGPQDGSSAPADAQMTMRGAGQGSSRATGLCFRACDIGSGAGFPGLALKIVLPHMHVTLVEPARKKAAFLRHVIRTLGLSGANVLETRA